MKSDFWLDQIPLWGVFGLTIVLVLLSIGIGIFLGNRERRKPEHEAEAPLGTVTGAALGLLAFLLAFTFGIASERYQTRMRFLLDEVNAIGTTYLRAGMLQEPQRSEICKLLREYVDIRANMAKESLPRQVNKLQEAISRSEALQDQMWSHAVVMAQADSKSQIYALFISSLNEMIDLHNSRLTIMGYRIPIAIWYALYFIAVLSMTMVGYQVGLSGKSNFIVGIVLALTFSAVIFLIADLDRSKEGSLKVNQQPMFELQKKMQMPIQETGYGQTPKR